MAYRKQNVRWEKPESKAKDRGKPRRNAALIVLCVVLALLATGLGAWALVSAQRVSRLTQRVVELEAQTQPASQAAAEPDASGAVYDYDPDTIVAEFDGGTVTAAEAVPEYQRLAAYYELAGSTPEEYAEDAKNTVLSTLVEEKILAMKARELGLDELSEEDRAAIAQQAENDYEQNVSYYLPFHTGEGKSEADARAETEAYLEESGITREGMLEEALRNATQQRLQDYVCADLSVDDAMLRSFYEEQLADSELTYTANFMAYEMDAETGTVLWNPEGIRRVGALLIPFDESQSVEYLSLSAAVDSGEEGSEARLDALYDALQPAAEQALARLQAGEDFSALRAELGSDIMPESICIGAQSELWGDDLRDAALALANIGDISGIVRTDGGLCILRYLEDVPAGPVPFEQVADELRSGYEEELRLSQYNDTVAQWIADANVQYYTDRF